MAVLSNVLWQVFGQQQILLKYRCGCSCLYCNTCRSLPLQMIDWCVFTTRMCVLQVERQAATLRCSLSMANLQAGTMGSMTSGSPPITGLQKKQQIRRSSLMQTQRASRQVPCTFTAVLVRAAHFSLSPALHMASQCGMAAPCKISAVTEHTEHTLHQAS